MKGFEVPNSPMDIDEAQKEADMMIGYLKKYYSERRIPQDTEPTNEDYELASKAIDEIKKAAEEQTDANELAYSIGRVLHNVGRVAGTPLLILEVFLEQFGPKDRMGMTENAGNYMMLHLDSTITERLTDATKILKQAEKDGRQVSKEG